MNIKLIIDKEILEKYCLEYFKTYPRRKKNPIDKPIPPSLNRFTAMKRMQQNDVKQKYKDFTVWLASYYSIANLKLDKARITYDFYFPDHRRRDYDNLCLTPKFFNDGLVEAGVLVDDDGERVKIEFGDFQYDKSNPRVEILIMECIDAKADL